LKAIKTTDGALNSLDKSFITGVPVEVTKDEAKYLKDTFGTVFIFEGDVEVAPEIKEEKPKTVKK
jgi:hypothetical protein